MKCLYEMSKDELLNEALKMRLVLDAVLFDKFDHIGAVKNAAEAALCSSFSYEKVCKAIEVYSKREVEYE